MHPLRALACFAVLATTSLVQAQMMNPGGMAGRGAGGSYSASRILHCDATFGMHATLGQGMSGYGPSAANPGPALQLALDRIAAQLALAPGQQPAWDAYAEAVLDQADDMAAFRDEMLTTTRTVVEWNRRQADFMFQRALGARLVADRMEALYAQLSAGQRAAFDASYSQCAVVPVP